MAGFRNFLLTFIISLVIFGIIAFFIVNMVLESLGVSSVLPNDDADPVQTGGDEYVEDTGNSALDELDGESFNMLFVGLDYAEIFYDYYDPDTVDKLIQQSDGKIPGELVTDGEYRRISADVIMLMSISKERGEFAFTSIHPGTRISRGSETVSLSDIYEEEGKNSFIDAVYELVDIPIDRYAFISMNKFPSVIDNLFDRGIEITVPFDMVYDDFKAGLHIDLKAGVQMINGEKLLHLLRFNKYEGTDGSRLDTTVYVVKRIMEELLTDTYRTKALGIFKDIDDDKVIETDFKVNDLVSNLDLIFSYSSFDAVTPELPGRYTTIDGELCFIPDQKGCANLLAPYGRNEK